MTYIHNRTLCDLKCIVIVCVITHVIVHGTLNMHYSRIPMARCMWLSGEGALHCLLYPVT